MGAVGPDETVWGKERGLDPELPPYPLVRHLLDAAAMALFLWDRWLSPNQRSRIAEGLGVGEDLARARALVGLCAGLHDIGKISGFQLCNARAKEPLSEQLRQDAGRLDESVGHDLAGLRAAPSVLTEALGFDAELGIQAALTRVSEIIGGHHGRYYRFEPPARRLAPAPGLGGRAWAEQRAAHAETVFRAMGKPLPPERIEAPAAVLVTGLVILADWLVSQETYLRDRQRQLGPLEEHFGRSMRDAEGLAKRAGLLPVELERKDFHEAYGIDGAPNPLQSSIAEELPAAVSSGSRKGGILLVTAAPGDGKSEAALEAERVMSAAFGTRGFAFLLPTMATSDKMHERVAGVLSRQAGRGAGLTLTHSMAWLSRAYADEDLEVGERVLVGEEHQSPVERQLAEMRPRWWLRGPKRPLLAQYAVGTIDQALMAVLPVRHNALRMLALSGKTFIVDEAHAYDPYMQVLLGRLLTWLGAYGVPVVLLSATLPASVSDKLIREYLSGAGHRDDEGRSFTCPYPGWLYVDGETGKCTGISPQRHEEQADERPITLQVDVRPVTRKVGGHTGGARPADDRLAVIADVLEPLAADKGTALVVCNTVAEAQATYTWLKTRFGSHLAEDDLMLLHARFPGEERERRTEIVVSGMGRQGVRPARRVIVATQVVEQSLDLDADVVISDLAPMALLLQRAGRCWRHEAYWSRQGRPEDRERPPWAVKSGPRLVVLDPIAGGGKVPVEWGEVYPEFLLSTTSHLLTEREGRPVVVPQDVQELVEAVHGERTDRYNWESPAMSEQWAAYAGKTAAERSVGRSLVIPSARKVTGLNGLHHQKGTEDEWQAATRLGVDSVRLLCVYDHGEDNLTFDAEGEQPLPKPDVKRRLAVADVRTIMSRTIPVSAGWFREEHEHHQPPDEWAEHPMLGDLLVLTQPVRNGRPQPVTVRGKQLRLDAELGLVRE